MQIHLIDNFETFNKLRKNWNSVYEADSQAQFFLSWVWLSKWLEFVLEPWFILAAKLDTHASNYVAFFPLKVTLNQQDDGSFYNELYMAGNNVSDFTGLICLPGYEAEVIPAFAKYITEQLTWSTLNLQDILEADTRMELFLKSFPEDSFEHSQFDLKNEGSDINNSICPYVPLADNWDQYLQTALGSQTRQKIRRLLRKVESSSELRITHVNADNLEQHIEILLKLWHSRWGSTRRDSGEWIMDFFRAILPYCFENQCLYFPVLWKGDTPIGAIASFIDVDRKSVLFYVGARDGTVKDLPPGLILHAYGIQYAIQNGFKVYDFLTGDEAYKFSFGAKERRTQCIELKRKNWISQDKILNVKTLPEALQLTAQYHRANELVEAEQGYCQILKAQPQHPDALYGLSALMRQKGEYQTAENLLRSLLQIQPNSTRIWFSMGNLHQVQGQFSEAVDAYRQAIALQPSPAIYNNLGFTLQQQCKWEDAIACYQEALELEPDCTEADVNLANALHAQGKLSSEKQVHYATVNNDLGTWCKEVGDLKTAIVHYRQAISMKPDLTEAHYNLGLVLQEQGELEAATTCYQKALEFKPDFEEARIQLDKLHQTQDSQTPPTKLIAR